MATYHALSTVDVFSMRHANDFDDCCCLGNRVNNLVRSDSNAVGVFGSAELLNSIWKGIRRQFSNRVYNSRNDFFRQSLSSLIADFFHSIVSNLRLLPFNVIRGHLSSVRPIVARGRLSAPRVVRRRQRGPRYPPKDPGIR